QATGPSVSSEAAPVMPTPPLPSPLVISIQALLIALGFEPGPADGFSGHQTAKAIAQFQTAIGDKPDGQPSEALKAKLQNAVAERSVRPPATTSAAPTPESAKPPREAVGSGTGFFISRDVLVTNQHLIDGCAEIRTRRSGADIGRAKVIAVSKSDDLAALRSDTPSESFLELRIGVPLKPAESILVFGYPLSGALSSAGNTTLGNITALTGLRDDSRYIQRRFAR
ncbi:MAG: trypsin-like peptidase domain-containing protein, partial [Acidimicrobiia bacterium]